MPGKALKGLGARRLEVSLHERFAVALSEVFPPMVAYEVATGRFRYLRERVLRARADALACLPEVEARVAFLRSTRISAKVLSVRLTSRRE